MGGSRNLILVGCPFFGTDCIGTAASVVWTAASVTSAPFHVAVVFIGNTVVPSECLSPDVVTFEAD